MLCFPQEPDLRYLIENIWGCQSALSGEKDLFELMMVRWDCSKPWSPWNCVLLTKQEAKGHTKLPSAEKVLEIMKSLLCTRTEYSNNNPFTSFVFNTLSLIRSLVCTVINNNTIVLCCLKMNTQSHCCILYRLMEPSLCRRSTIAMFLLGTISLTFLV